MILPLSSVFSGSDAFSCDLRRFSALSIYFKGNCSKRPQLDAVRPYAHSNEAKGSCNLLHLCCKCCSVYLFGLSLVAGIGHIGGAG